MSTDPKSLHEKLDAMIDAADQGYFTPTEEVVYSVALDLLARLDAAETPGTADALKRCVWSAPESSAVGYDEESIYPTCGWSGYWSGNAPSFCPGCGHPVQVKQKEDSHD